MGSNDSNPSGAQEARTVYTIDDLIRERGRDTDQQPLIGFPKHKEDVTDYAYFTGRDINRMIDGAAGTLISLGLPPVDQEVVVGIIGQSDLDFVVNVLALGRLGYATLIISPRLDEQATLGLLRDLGAHALLYTNRFDGKAAFVRAHSSLQTIAVIQSEQYDTISSSSPPARTNDGPSETAKTCIIMHSSGSTGKPRPIIYPHRRLLHTLVNAQNLTAFLSVPVYHAHGLVSFLQALYKRKTVWLFNGNLPQTHDTVTAAIREAQPEIVWTVPYVLKLIAEKQDGIEMLRKCKIVSSGGSRTPDELGNLLVSQGVHLGTSFGATEVAFVMSNLNRPPDDKAWDYMAVPPHVAPFIWMKPVEKDVFELVVLDGHKGKITSNSDNPPNSFHTKDLFIPHPTLKARWKYIGRLDDRITLNNGEKFIPLDIEGRVRQDPLVKEAVVFGVERPLPGLLLFKSDAAASLSDLEYIDRLWPVISECNDQTSDFGKIGKDYIAVLPETTDCPSTDKQSIKRAQIYQNFADIIDSIYAERTVSSGGLKLDLRELEDWLVSQFRVEFGILLPNNNTDFFAAGIDSQKAIQMRRMIVSNLDLGGRLEELSSLVVFEQGTVASLAQYLYDLQTGSDTTVTDEIELMEELQAKYNSVTPFSPGASPYPSHATVLLTGATGTLGSAILAELHILTSTQIYCPVRATGQKEAVLRIISTLALSGHGYNELPPNIHPFPCDLSHTPLPIPPEALSTFGTELTHVIHAAWPVNFSLHLSSFESQLASLRSLYDLTTSVSTPQAATFLFCSSISTALSSPPGTIIQDASIPSLSSAAPSGYARSKLVAERILEAAHSVNRNTSVLRIGQITPPADERPKRSKLWTPTEVIPLIINSAKPLQALPDTPGPWASDTCTWLPANILASVILDIAGITLQIQDDHPEKVSRLNSAPFYNLMNPHPFSWTGDFLPTLRATSDLDFEVIKFDDWFERLSQRADQQQQSNELGQTRTKSEIPVLSFSNPPCIRLLGIWKDHRPVGLRQIQEDFTGDFAKGIVFETIAAETDSQIFRTSDWNAVISEEYVTDLVAEWTRFWGWQ